MDIDHFFGGDIANHVARDLPTVNSDIETQRKIIRRLATNPKDYLWHPEYGAGLRRFVGATNLGEVEGVCVSQVAMEENVASYPAPTVTLQMSEGALVCLVTYTDATSNELKNFSFNIQE